MKDTFPISHKIMRANELTTSGKIAYISLRFALYHEEQRIDIYDLLNLFVIDTWGIFSYKYQRIL